MKITVEYDENDDSAAYVLPSIVYAEYAGGLCVRLTFSDGKKNVIDVGEFLERRPHPQYNKYKKVENFKKFRIEDGNIEWGKNADLVFHLEELYEGKIG